MCLQEGHGCTQQMSTRLLTSPLQVPFSTLNSVPDALRTLKTYVSLANGLCTFRRSRCCLCCLADGGQLLSCQNILLSLLSEHYVVLCVIYRKQGHFYFFSVSGSLPPPPVTRFPSQTCPPSCPNQLHAPVGIYTRRRAFGLRGTFETAVFLHLNAGVHSLHVPTYLLAFYLNVN